MKLRAIMLSLLAFAAVACSARAEDATDYPSRKIKMLLPFGAGGGGDVLGRLLADRMGNRLGQTIYVENRTGAAGTIGAQQAATSPPDGYTITLAISLFLGMVVGGVGWLPGSFIGAAFIIFVPNIAESINKGLSGAVFGVLLFLVIFLVPHGARQVAIVGQQLIGRFKKN